VYYNLLATQHFIGQNNKTPSIGAKRTTNTMPMAAGTR